MKTPEELATLAKPAVHSNGTNGNVLFEEYRAAMDAVNNALTVLSQITLHGRDYYVQEVGAFQKAQNEMIERAHKLAEVKQELEHIAIYLMDYADGGQYGRKV